MRKRFLALLCILALGCSLTACKTEKDAVESVLATTTESATTESASMEVQAESVEYWISLLENPDEVIMSAEEIAAENQYLLQSNTDWVSGYYNIQAFPELISEADIQILKEVRDLRDATLYLDGHVISQEEWKVYYENSHETPNSSVVKNVSYGVVIHNTSLFDLPTNDIFTGSDLDERFNQLQQTSLKINEPVVILDESEDGEWLYIVACEYIGWVEKKNCAYFKNRDQWLNYMANENFLTVLADDGIAEIEEPLLMGTKLYLDGDSENALRMPQKDGDGFYTYEIVNIVTNDSVTKGYLPCTRRNILELAFSQLGQPYGWGGANGDRDCSSYVKDIYACFGLQLPRNSRLQMSMLSIGESLANTTETKKVNAVDASEVGDIMGISGHVMLYIGSANGQHYVISMLSSYIPEDVSENFKEHIEEPNKVMVNTLDVKRGNGNTWLQELVGIVHMGQAGE